VTQGPVATSSADRRKPGLDVSAKAAMRLPREVFEEQRVHRALEPDVKLADLSFRERNIDMTGSRAASNATRIWNRFSAHALASSVCSRHSNANSPENSHTGSS